MRLVLPRFSPLAASCQGWHTAAIASPPEGPVNPTLDYYWADVRIGSGQTASATFDRIRNRLFTYATVEGHAERGVATFQVTWDEDQEVAVLIDVRSRPGTLLTRLGRPAARLFQRAITIAALRRLSRS